MARAVQRLVKASASRGSAARLFLQPEALLLDAEVQAMRTILHIPSVDPMVVTEHRAGNTGALPTCPLHLAAGRVPGRWLSRIWWFVAGPKWGGGR